MRWPPTAAAILLARTMPVIRFKPLLATVACVYRQAALLHEPGASRHLNGALATSTFRGLVKTLKIKVS